MVEFNNQDSWHLRPKARIMKAIGEDLISSETVALMELVKNSYDADATTVLIRFTGPLEKRSGRIEIIDNGHGMSLSTLQTVWLEPATTFKRDKKRSIGGRRFLGEKGIGRFGASRLAYELLVTSREPKSNTEAVVLFDWTQFDDKKYLDEVEVLPQIQDVSEITPDGILNEIRLLGGENIPDRIDWISGTILQMDNLKESWDRANIENLRTQLSRLISPYGQTDFRIYISLPEPYQDLSGEITSFEALKHPHYHLSGSINQYGGYDLNIDIRGEKHHVNKPVATSSRFSYKEGLPTECGPFNVDFSVWDRDPESIRELSDQFNTTVQNIRDTMKSVSGVSVYRDGFRVLPYGEQGNDWLKLDNRRIQNTRLRVGNDRIIGYVGISGDGNEQLKDQSNREGLRASVALEQFKDLITIVLSELETLRYAARQRQKQETPGSIFENFDLNAVYNYATNRYPQDKELQLFLDAQRKELSDKVEKAQEVIIRYRRLATLGQLIDGVLHDGRPIMSQIGNAVHRGLRKINNDKDDEIEKITYLEEQFSKIDKQRHRFTTVFNRIEPFGGRKRGKPKKIQFEQIIRDSFEVIEGDLQRSQVEIDLPATNHEVTVDPAEMQEVFVNLAMNSLYWFNPEIGEDDENFIEKTENPRILVSVQQLGDGSLEVIFSDNGPGIDLSDPSIIFEPYFSQKSNGVGLGLTIVGEILHDYYDGGIELLSSGPLSGATFRLTLRKRV